jgi:ATP-dependent Clp protease ATP-binding subunit ClpA
MIGAIVRLCVVLFGVITWSAVIGCGTIAIILYITAPVAMIVSITMFFGVSQVVGVVLFFATCFVIFFALQVYYIGGHMPYKYMTIRQLHEQKWFHRVYAYIGVEPSDIPYDLLDDYDRFAQFLATRDVTGDDFDMVVAWETQRQIEREEHAYFLSVSRLAQIRPIGLRWHYGYTIHLDRYAEDLTARPVHSYSEHTFFGFEQEMQMLEIVLARPHENNAILTAQAGTGRHMIIHELARRIRTGFYDGTYLQYMRILQCDFTSVMAQARSIGADQEFVIHNLFHEAAYAGNVIFVVDNFEQYMDANDNRDFSFITIIDEYASLPTFRMVALATEEAFHENIASEQIITRHFDVIPVHEMSADHALKILFMRFCRDHAAPFTLQALRQIISNADRYTNDAPLPTRAIDLAMEVVLYWQKSGEQFITVDVVDGFVREKTGIPVGKIMQKEQDQLLSLENLFHQKIIGQHAAVQTVASAVRRMRSGVGHTDKPAGSFLFLGPTGVGKTEMAKTVAQQYFGSQDKVVRIDMSEYQGDHAIDRLIGSKELNQQGTFVSEVREHPYALLLLDEIDKANPRVLDLFLQILDEGFAHDAFGRKVSFNTMIIIATSNAGALTIKKMVEMDINPADMEKKVVDVIINDGIFRPEFINRFDDIVIFDPLAGDDVHSIAQLLLEKFADRVADEHNIDIDFDPEIAREIIRRGYDPVFGARSLARFIDDKIADVLAKKLITGNVRRGEHLRFSVLDMEV